MANVVHDHIVTIDSTGVITTENVVITGVRVRPGAATDAVILEDSAGNVVWRHLNAGATLSQESHITFRSRGLVVDTITAGCVAEIYFDLDSGPS